MSIMSGGTKKSEEAMRGKTQEVGHFVWKFGLCRSTRASARSGVSKEEARARDSRRSQEPGPCERLIPQRCALAQFAAGPALAHICRKKKKKKKKMECLIKMQRDAKKEENVIST